MRLWWWLGLTAVPFAFTRPALAEQPDSPCVCPDRAAAGAAAEQEEQEFNSALARFERLWAFTQRLLAERSENDFERDAGREARRAEFTASLEQQRERDFEANVALYVRKLEFTRALEDSSWF